MDQYLLYISSFFSKIGGKLTTFSLRVSEKLISHCTKPNNAPGSILSNNWSWRNGLFYGNDSLKCSFTDTAVFQSCGVSTNRSLTFPNYCNLPPRYNVSAFHPLSSFLFHIECPLQLEQVVPLDKDNNDRNNPLLQILCCNVHKTQMRWINQSFSEFLLCKSSQFCSSVLLVENTTLPFFRNF